MKVCNERVQCVSKVKRGRVGLATGIIPPNVWNGHNVEVKQQCRWLASRCHDY